MNITTRYSFVKVISILLAFVLILSMVPIKLSYAQQEGSQEVTESSDDGSSLHTQGKNLFETERVSLTLPVKDESGTQVEGVKFQIWNATKQVNEAELTSTGSGIQVSLIKNHNYIFFPIDTTWEGKTYVWVRDGKLVSTKSLSIESVASPEVWSYPEVTQITLSKRQTALTDANDARRGSLTWQVLSNQQPGAYSGLTFTFKSDIETLTVGATTSSNATSVSANLLEDVNYLVSVSSTGGSFAIDPFPIVYKDKSEYPESLREYWPLVSAYDHRCCYQIRYFDLMRKDDAGAGYNQISNDDRTVSVRGIDFTDERSGRTPQLITNVTEEIISGISGDHEVYDIKARNTARDENCKMFGNAFTTEIQVSSTKIVGKLYRVDENNTATEIASDKWRQLKDGTVIFETESLGCDKYALVYGGVTQHNFDNVLGVQVVDDEGSAIKGVSLKLGTTNLSGTTDEYGYLNCDVSSLADGDNLSLTLQNEDKYTVKTPASVKVSGGKISQVDSKDYSGYATVVVDALNKNQVLKLRAVDGVGNPVRGVEFKLVNSSAEFADQDTYYFTSPTGVDGLATFSLPDDEMEAMKFEGDWDLKTTDSTDNTQSMYALKSAHTVTVEANDDFVDVFTYIDETEYDGKAYVDVEVVVPAYVTFDLGGYGEDQYVTLNVGDTLTKPADPTKSGATFEGWFTDATFTTQFDFTKGIESDIIIYAKWQSDWTINLVDTTTGQTDEGQSTAGSGSSTLLVNGEAYDAATTTLKAGDKISLRVAAKETSANATATETSAVNNVTLFKSASINGVSLSATYEKSTWTQDNAEWIRRMGEAAQEVSYDKVKASTLAGLTTSEYTVTGNETTFDIAVEYQECVPVYRLYNMITSEHLFTTQKSEYDNWVAISTKNEDAWIGEGIAWLSQTGGTPVYRLYNAALGALGQNSHYYTLDEQEIANLTTNAGWVKESLSTTGEVFQSGGDNAIYTCYNEALRSAHHYTSSKTEWEGLKAHGWDLEESKNNAGTGFFKCYMPTK